MFLVEPNGMTQFGIMTKVRVMPVDKYFFGTIGNDRGATALHGTDSSNFVDHIYGYNGNDQLYGYAGTDFLYGADGDDLLDGGTGVDFIFGGSGFDVLTYDSSSAAVNVSLLTGAASGGSASGDTFAQIESLVGSRYGDVLEGSDSGINALDGGKGNDTLRGHGGFDLLEGGRGNDVLDGGTGVDALWGEQGADRFVYDSVADAPSGTAARETIGDFSQAQKDKIDLSGLATGNGDAKFDFVGPSSFYEAGQVRYVHDGASTAVQINTDADSQAEMTIWLSGTFNLKAGDFVL